MRCHNFCAYSIASKGQPRFGLITSLRHMPTRTFVESTRRAIFLKQGNFLNVGLNMRDHAICQRFAMQQKCIYRLIHQPRTQPQLKEGNIRRNDESISARQMSSWYIVSCLRSGCNLTPTFSLAGEIANVAAENWWGVLDVVNSYHVPTFVRYCFGFEDNLFYYPNQWSSGTFE